MNELTPKQEVEESLSQQSDSFPQVVDESGKLLQRSDIVQMATQLAQVAQLAKIRKSLERQEFEGKLDPRILNATDQQQFIGFVNEWPYTPWISVFIINNGPNSVQISINKSATWFTVRSGATRFIDRSRADERIEQIYYQCAAGDNASVELEGTY